jgi:hypothetical protein
VELQNDFIIQRIYKGKSVAIYNESIFFDMIHVGGRDIQEHISRDIKLFPNGKYFENEKK